jgi:hypothetical protein
MSRRRNASSAVLAALLVIGALAISPATAEDAEPATADAVIGFIDTGINPYHTTFRDTSDRAQQHPSTYIEGYPEDAVALHLTLDAEEYRAAVVADCERIWKQVKPGQLYWFPGTKIIGATSTNPAGNVQCGAEGPTGQVILDTNGHGTMVASRGASNEYGACPDCLVVAIQFPGSVNLINPGASNAPTLAAIRWTAANADWIDAQSNSWGPIVPGWEPTGQAGLLTAGPALVRAVEEVSQAHLAFWASGNGAAFRGGVLGHPTLLTPHFTPSAITVGGHDSGQVNVWPGFPPHLVSDSCSSWAARINTLDESRENQGGGTSAATPFVAGGAGEILRQARVLLGDDRTGVRTDADGTQIVAEGDPGAIDSGPLADGVLTMEEWKRLTYVTATPRPVRQHEDGPPCGPGPYGPTPILWKDVPDEYPEFLHIGYGAVDGPAVELAGKVLRGEAAAPARDRTDQYFALDHEVREATHPVWRGP